MLIRGFILLSSYYSHGLCVSTFNQQCYPDEWKQGDDIRSYFATTVYTFKQFDVQAALTNQGITPSDSTPTSIAQLNKALELEWTAMKDERAGEDDMSEKGGHHQHLQKRSPRGGSKKDWWGRWKYKDDGGEFERNPGFRVQWWCTERSSSYSSSVDHKGSSDFNTTVSTNALSHEATTIRKSYWLTDAVVNLHATPGLHVADGTYANIDGEEDGDGHHHRRVLKLDLAPSKDQRPRTIEGCDAGPDDDIYIKE